MNSDQTLPWVSRLAEARMRAQRITDRTVDIEPKEVDEGYRIAIAVGDKLGWDALGWKIAGTTVEVRKKLAITEPIYGRTWRQFASRSPARLKHSDLLDPLVECEFFVTLGKSLAWRSHAWTYADIVESVAQVHAGIEVAECRFPNADLPKLPLILADGAASGRYVFGSEINDWRSGLAAIPVQLLVDGRLLRSGKGEDVMGDPLLPLLWLAEEQRKLGSGLAKGEMVSTGSCTGMLPVRVGQTVVANFGVTASVEIAFD